MNTAAQEKKGTDTPSLRSIQEKYVTGEDPVVENQQPKKSWMSKFRFTADTSEHPPEIFNMTLYLSIFLFGLFGAARGLDEGNSMYLSENAEGGWGGEKKNTIIKKEQDKKEKRTKKTQNSDMKNSRT